MEQLRGGGGRQVELGEINVEDGLNRRGGDGEGNDGEGNAEGSREGQ